MFIAKEKLHFSLICSFYCFLVKRGCALKVAKQFATRGLVTYKLVAYKKNCNKSTPDFSISRLANVEDIFNVIIFFKCKYLRIKDYLFKYFCVVCCLKIPFCCLSFSATSNLNSADSQQQTLIRYFNYRNRDAA